ncbi:MAG: hypothetical protein LUE25_07635 [Clostridiales bacterium]|nr:hypothetical protein [Clostridiales bacterium]MCD8311985.1 hypothetical protein [Bacillota bacterium]
MDMNIDIGKLLEAYNFTEDDFEDMMLYLSEKNTALVSCPNGGVCNASCRCKKTSHTEIENNNVNLQLNSSANS